MKKVFLGGTCNGSEWRDYFIVMIHGMVDYFNPVVRAWNAESQQREISERGHCDYCLYCITPKMHGVYSVAEVVDDSNKRPLKTVMVILDRDGDHVFDQGQTKSLSAVAKMVERNGGKVFTALLDAALYVCGKDG